MRLEHLHPEMAANVARMAENLYAGVIIHDIQTGGMGKTLTEQEVKALPRTAMQVSVDAASMSRFKMVNGPDPSSKMHESLLDFERAVGDAARALQILAASGVVREPRIELEGPIDTAGRAVCTLDIAEAADLEVSEEVRERIAGLYLSVVGAEVIRWFYMPMLEAAAKNPDAEIPKPTDLH